MTQDNDAQDAGAELDNEQNAAQAQTSGDQAEPETGAEQTSPSSERRSRLILLSIVILLCLSVGCAWFGYWVWKELNTLQVAVADVESAAQADAMKLADEQQKKREAVVAEVHSALADTHERIGSLAGSIDSLGSQLAQSNASKPAALVVAELEYLLRLANHRLALESDRDGALFALAIVQARLSELDSDGFKPLQSQLTSDMAALQSVEGPATTRAMGTLTKLIEDVDSLQSDNQAKTAGTGSASSESSQSGWKAVVSSMTGNLSRFVDVRKAEGSAVPALIPDQEKLAKQNIRLSLANARAAALRGDTQTYQLSVQESERWLSDYFPGDMPAVVAMKVQLSALKGLVLRPTLPTLDASLAMIRAISHTDLYLDTQVSTQHTTSSVDDVNDEETDGMVDHSVSGEMNHEHTEPAATDVRQAGNAAESSEAEAMTDANAQPDTAVDDTGSSEMGDDGVQNIESQAIVESDMTQTAPATSEAEVFDEGADLGSLVEQAVGELVEQQDSAAEALEEASQ